MTSGAAPSPALRIGLTGGIGSGKSTVAGMLQTLGAWLVDTDALARALTAPGGAALPQIVDAFGAGMIAADGSMDRARMRALVFDDPAQRLRLEAILHPMIGDATRAQEARAAPGQPIVFDVPLLAESIHWRRRVDRVLVVDCTVDTQRMRVRARSGWADEAIDRVIAQQASRERRRAIADAVVVNETLSLEALQQEVTAVWRAWCRWGAAEASQGRQL